MNILCKTSNYYAINSSLEVLRVAGPLGGEVTALFCRCAEWEIIGPFKNINNVASLLLEANTRED